MKIFFFKNTVKKLWKFENGRWGKVENLNLFKNVIINTKLKNVIINIKLKMLLLTQN